MRLNVFKCICKVIDDILIVLRTDAQTDSGRIDVLLLQFIGREL